jgi:hypothetical protein
VPTIMHAIAVVQRPGILFTLGLSLMFAAAVLVVALSSSDHPLVLTSVLSHLQAVHPGTQFLASGNPPPPLPCGGGVGTHC